MLRELLPVETTSLKEAGWAGRFTTVSKSSEPIVSPSQVVAAGAASAGAAGVTSSVGVAGTLIGAAITTMIITGGSAILKAYLESASGTFKQVPGKMRATANRRKAGRVDEAPPTLPDNPRLQNNFMGRLRAALSWFSRLPVSRRRPILIKGAIAALVAFVISIGIVTAAEKGIDNSLACGFWGKCPTGAEPGVHFGATRGTGASSSYTFARSNSTTAPNVDPATGNEVQEDGTPAAVEEQPVPRVDPAPAQDPAESVDPAQPPVEEAPVEEAPVEVVPEEAPVEAPADVPGGAVEEAPAE